MYRDSQLGLCIDITGPDGNIFVLWSMGNDLAVQLGQEKEWKEAREAGKRLSSYYVFQINIFRSFFPLVTLIGYDEVVERETE